MSVDGEELPAARTSRLLWKCGVVAVLLLAAFIRAIPLDTGLPYTSYVDEAYGLQGSAHMLDDRTIDPDFYGYPSFIVNSAAFTALTMATVTGRLDELVDGVNRTDESLVYQQIEPVELVVGGRLVVLALSIGTVALTLAIGCRLGGRRLGLVAGFFVALLPALVSRGAIVIVDTPATFFVMATLLVGHRFSTSNHPSRIAALAGVTTGLAITSKYPSGLVILSVFAFMAMATSFPVRQRITAAAITVGTTIATVVIVMPGLVLSFSAAKDEILALSDVYESKSLPSYATEIQRPQEVGWFILAPAIVGLALLLWSKRSRGFTIAWLAVALPLYLYTSSYPYQPFRNVLPLLPGLCLAAAATLVAAGDGLGRLVPREPGRRIVAAVVPGAAALFIGFQLYANGLEEFLEFQLDDVNSRVETVNWLQDQTGPEDRVLLAEELYLLPSEVADIPGEVTIAPAVMFVDGDTSDISAEDYDVVVTALFRVPAFEWAQPRPPGTEVAKFGSTGPVAPFPNLFQPPTTPIFIYRP